ncbi:unnamed protein product [Closterium sp. NIES-54]
MKELETRWGPAPSGVSKVDPLPSTAPVQVAVVSGAAPGAASVGAVSGGAASEGAEPGGAGSKGDGSGGAEPKGVEPRGAESEGAEFGSAAGASPRMSSPRMSSQQLREWLVQRAHSRSGAPRAGGPGDTGSGGAAVTAGAGDPTEPGAAGAGGAGAGVAGVGGPGAGGAGAAGAGVGGTSAGGAGAAGAGAVDPRAGGAGGTVRSRPYFVPLLQQVLGVPSSTGLPPPFLCPPLDQSQPPLQLASPLHVPSHYTKQFGGLTERREPASHPVSPVRTAHRAPRLRPPPVPGTHTMALRPSSVPLCVPLPAPPEFSLPEVPDPESDRAHAASPTVARLLATTVTDPSFESAAASALVAELLGFSAACRLDYVSALVVESVPTSPPSIGGECALGTDVLEDRQEDFECLAAAVPRFASMLLAPEKDPDAPDIPTPRSYAEAIMGPYSSHWQAAMDAEMACWKSTGTYIDAVLPSEANIVDGMWILRGVDYFQTFFPTPKMTTLRLLLHVAARRDYELHSLDFSTASLQGSLHEEIWLRRPPGFTGTFPTGTQWSLRQPVYGLRQTPCEWHDTLRITLAALGFVPSTADPSLFLRTDTLLPPFYVLVYVDDLVFATADTEALTLVLQRFGFQFSSPQLTPLSTSHSLSAPPSDESVEPSGPYPELVGCLMYLMTCTRPDLAYPLSLVACYVAPSRHRKVHWDAAKRVLRYLCSTLGMGLVLGGRGPIVLTGHADASRVHDSATQRSSQGYTFSLSSDSVSWWSTRSSSVLSSSCEAEIYAGTMAAQKLSWLTYLLTDLGEQPRSPPVLYVDNKAMIALCQEHRLEHRTKHIALRYFLARELQQRGQLRLAYVATRANTADVFTKALPPVCGDVVIHPELCFFVNGLHRVRPRVIASGHVLPRAGACGRVRARAGGMEALKQKGNEAFKKGQFSAAALAYRRALEAAAESGEAPRETASLHSNLSCSLLKLGHREEALEAAQQCTELREEWNKVRCCEGERKVWGGGKGPGLRVRSKMQRRAGGAGRGTAVGGELTWFGRMGQGTWVGMACTSSHACMHAATHACKQPPMHACVDARSCASSSHLPPSSQGWFRKGEALFALQRYDEAEEAYRQALDRGRLLCWVLRLAHFTMAIGMHLHLSRFLPALHLPLHTRFTLGMQQVPAIVVHFTAAAAPSSHSLPPHHCVNFGPPSPPWSSPPPWPSSPPSLGPWSPSCPPPCGAGARRCDGEAMSAVGAGGSAGLPAAPGDVRPPSLSACHACATHPTPSRFHAIYAMWALPAQVRPPCLPRCALPALAAPVCDHKHTIKRVHSTSLSSSPRACCMHSHAYTHTLVIHQRPSPSLIPLLSCLAHPLIPTPPTPHFPNRPSHIPHSFMRAGHAGQIFRSAQQMRNFIYLVGDAHSREAIVVDGAWDVEVRRLAALPLCCFDQCCVPPRMVSGKSQSLSDCHGCHLSRIPARFFTSPAVPLTPHRCGADPPHRCMPTSTMRRCCDPRMAFPVTPLWRSRYGGGTVEVQWRYGGGVAQIWWGYRGGIVEIWLRYGRGMAEVWWRYGGDMAEVWWRYGGGMAEVWRRYGGGIEIWQRYGGGMAELWRKYGRGVAGVWRKYGGGIVEVC